MYPAIGKNTYHVSLIFNSDLTSYTYINIIYTVCIFNLLLTINCIG